jgi:UPF0716 protein FxsA
VLVLLLVIAFIVVPIAELAIIIAIGGQIGWLWTVVLLLADAVLGSLLVRWQGRAAWRRFTEAMQAGRPPARETIDGALVLLGGAFLLTPGFISDLLGVVLLLPPSRAVVRKVLARRLVARMTASMMRPVDGTRTRPRQDFDVEGTAVDSERRRLEGE